MVNSFADWLCNLLVWGAVLTLVALLYEVFVARGMLATPIAALSALAVAVVLSAFWPKY